MSVAGLWSAAVPETDAFSVPGLGWALCDLHCLPLPGLSEVVSASGMS